MSEAQPDAELKATINDIFEDVRDLVSAVPDTVRKQELAALVDVKEARFKWLYDDSRYQHNGQNSYGLLFVFIHTIKDDLRRDDNQAHKVAVFLMQFCAEMYVMWGTRAEAGETHSGRIEERMLRYYTTCPDSLRMAKLRRAAMTKAMRNLCIHLKQGIFYHADGWSGWRSASSADSPIKYILDSQFRKLMDSENYVSASHDLTITLRKWGRQIYDDAIGLGLDVVAEDVMECCRLAGINIDPNKKNEDVVVNAGGGPVGAVKKNEDVAAGEQKVTGQAMKAAMKNMSVGKMSGRAEGASMHALLRQLDTLK